jgi:hypothetical protein
MQLTLLRHDESVWTGKIDVPGGGRIEWQQTLERTAAKLDEKVQITNKAHSGDATSAIALVCHQEGGHYNAK